MSRRPTSVRLAVLAGLCAACLLAAAASGRAQQPKVKVSFQGTQIFSHLLHGANLKPLGSVADLADVEPADTLIVVFGDLKVLDDLKKVKGKLAKGGLAKFHALGGAVLIASDRPDHLKRLADFKVILGSSQYLECPPADLKHAYRKDAQFVFVRTAIGLHHPLFVGLRKGLATNHPSSLGREDDCDLQTLCVYPTAQYQQWRRGWTFLHEAPFIAGTANDSIPNERLVIIPGHGMFMNGLMFQGDNDNYPFAVNCIRWLTDGGKRKHVLFVVENEVKTDLALPLAPPPIPTARFVNALLRALEEENIFNQLLLTFVSKDTLLRTALIVGSVLLVVLALGRFLRGRLPMSKELLLSRRVARQQAAPPLIVQRHWDVLRRGNLWEAARVLARQCFEGTAARKPEAPPAGRPGQAPVAAGLWHCGATGRHAGVRPLVDGTRHGACGAGRWHPVIPGGAAARTGERGASAPRSCQTLSAQVVRCTGGLTPPARLNYNHPTASVFSHRPRATTTASPMTASLNFETGPEALQHWAARIRTLGEQTIAEVGRVVVGMEHVTHQFLIALLAGGHVLLEGVPGVAKTTLSKTFARILGIQYQRLQFTPDLLPSDVTGTYIFDRKTNDFVLRKGPLFCQVLLADEVNRAPAKTQAALLEAMQEQQVTIEGTTLHLPLPFMVLATQNPVEQEGVYRLPEAQLDRFLLRVEMGYPHPKQEVAMLRLHSSPVQEVQELFTPESILEMQQQVPLVFGRDDLLNYIVDLSEASREHRDVALGASPRASLSLLRCARARALLAGRHYFTHEDVQAVALGVLGHRLIIRPEAEVEGKTTAQVVREVLDLVPVLETT